DDFHLPWRMLYTHPNPTEPLAEDGSNFHPNGFWGYQHIIEVYTTNIEPVEKISPDHVTAKDGKLGFAAALDEMIDTKFRVRCIGRHRDFVRSSSGRLTYNEWNRKADVTNGLRCQPFQHQAVYFLCHAEGAGPETKPSLQAPVLQFMDGSIDATELRE